MKRLLFLIALIPSFLIAQHSISGVFSPSEDYSYAFLYNATPKGLNFLNNAKLAEDGSFSMPLDSTATPGIYKIVYAIPPEENNFDFIYNGKESVAFTLSMNDGLEFTSSNENKLWASYIKSMEMVNRTISNFYAQESTDKKAFKEIFKTLSDTQKAYEESSKGMMASVFIKANTPYIPEGFENLTKYSKNLKRTYLDHVDFNNPLLQSSDFLVDRVLAYLFGMTANTSNDLYKKDVDDLMVKIGDGNSELKTTLFEMIWRRFKSMDNAELANYVTDTYLLKLTELTNNDELQKQLMNYRNNAIGNKAANFDLSYIKDETKIASSLHDLELTNQYLVIFWSSTCSHCLEELPKVKQLLAAKKDLTVIAIGLEDDAENWQKAIEAYPDFIHVLGLEKWDNPLASTYAIEATPSFFLLDKDKTIIAKPYDVENLKEFLK
ncbi:TlpA family protein disulfide reductase [Psychroserpens sp. Hel_I_66]|uniref:TlpA family protein disulfide reductase n=1 Tax=Psychroserpens sp. Hel_I_66 TaxID=1250004 RepID=UPI0006470FBE|nr:TlpA disulfide reductase family protein [Psychroserpens sp. Hel_I_66]